MSASSLPGDDRASASAAGLLADHGRIKVAAICRARETALATRNLVDFDKTGVEVINPWHTEA